MKRTACTIILIAVLSGPAGATTDFWTHFANKITYDVSVHAGALPSNIQSRRLSSDAVAHIASRAFLQSLPIRIGEVAKESRFAAIPCTFTPAPEKCFVNVVLNRTFDEVRFMNAPGVSAGFAKKIFKSYTRNIRLKETPVETAQRAVRINRWKPFNPRIGFDYTRSDIVVATPFYTYFGIYVEPKFTLRTEGVVTLLKKNVVVEFTREGAAISYKFKKKPFGKNFYSITIRPEGEFTIDNVINTW